MATLEALVNFDGMTDGIRDSFNVSAITDSPTFYEVHFTAPISNINYLAFLCAGNGVADSVRWLASGPLTQDPTVNSFCMWSGAAGARISLNYEYCAIFTNP